MQVSLDKDSCYCSNSRLGASESGRTCYYTETYVGCEDGAFYCQHCHRDYDICDLDGVGEVTTELGSGPGQSATLGLCTEGTFTGADLPCCPYCGHNPQSTVNDTACTLQGQYSLSVFDLNMSSKCSP